MVSAEVECLAPVPAVYCNKSVYLYAYAHTWTSINTLSRLAWDVSEYLELGITKGLVLTVIRRPKTRVLNTTATVTIANGRLEIRPRICLNMATRANRCRWRTNEAYNNIGLQNCSMKVVEGQKKQRRLT